MSLESKELVLGERDLVGQLAPPNYNATRRSDSDPPALSRAALKRHFRPVSRRQASTMNALDQWE